MSGIKEIIEIVPPKGVFGYRQSLDSKAYQCPVCNGRGGWHIGEHDPGYSENNNFSMCGYCQGSGRIRAKITVVWNADIPEVRPVANPAKLARIEVCLRGLGSVNLILPDDCEFKNLMNPHEK